MKAITVKPKKPGTAQYEDFPEPDVHEGSVLVEAVAVGVCGTDVETVDGKYGWAPPGKTRLVLGHESLGRVIDPGPRSSLKEGDLVVGIVRRPDPVPCPSCAVGEWAFITQVGLDDSPEDRAHTLGRPYPQVEVKIVEPQTGATAAIGQIGELCTRGFHVMSEYFDQPEATAQAIDAEGWLRTGDLASMDERGFFRIEGRLKEMIIRGGENIYPREIEEVLFRHPAVAEAAVVGLPDETWGEQVTAFIRLAPGQTADEQQLFTYCREKLADYKTPRTWVFVDSFPLTASGKIQKFVLREQYVSGRRA